jgi:hypothetical protein
MLRRLVSSCALVGCLATLTIAADLQVHAGQSIQTAIDAAQNGDRVLVHPGTYTEAITFKNVDLELVGIGGASVTTIDAGPLSSPFNTTSTVRIIHPAPAKLRGFRITGGTGNESGPASRGGGIYAPGANAVIEECVIENNLTMGTGIFGPSYGGGAYLAAVNTSQTGVPLLRRCIVRNNFTGLSGGGVFGGRLEHCLIANNVSQISGGGVAQVVDLRACRIVGNSATFGGGAFFPASSPPSVPKFADVLLRGNTAQVGGGMALEALAAAPFSFVIENLRFEANTATVQGGGLDLYTGVQVTGLALNVLLRNCTFAGNVAPALAGSGIRQKTVLGDGVTSSNVSVGIDRCTFNGDDAVLGSQVHKVTNSIFVGSNSPLWFLGGSASVDSCIVPLPYPGTGSFNANPAFVDGASGDLHLTTGSPAVDVGVATANGAAPFDFEGDAPVGAADIGADERAPHLYLVGDPSPGNVVHLRVVGPPGAQATLFLSQTRLVAPIVTPAGEFALGFPIWFNMSIPLGVIPASGVLSIAETISPSIPCFATLHAQVLLQSPNTLVLTNAATVVVL